VASHGIAGRLLLTLDRLSLGQPIRGCTHAVDRVGQVDGRRSGGFEDGGGLGRGIDGRAVACGDADQRGTANGEAADGLRDLLGGTELEPLLAPGKRGLVKRPEGSGLEAQRSWPRRIADELRG
jgi:hypothetical protein